MIQKLGNEFVVGSKKEECFETGEGPVETTLGDFAWRLTKKGDATASANKGSWKNSGGH